MDIKLNTEIIDIIKGLVILGSEVSNALSDTDYEDAKTKNTTPQEKKKLQYHKFKTQVDSHLRVLFPSIKLTVSSSDFGNLVMSLKSCSIISSMKPTIFQHTNMFVIKQASVELVDQSEKRDEKQLGAACIQIQNFAISESLMIKSAEEQKDAKKRRRKKKSTKKDQEENTVFVSCITIGLKMIESQFNSSQKFLVKVFGFEREWEKAIRCCKSDLVYIMQPKQESFLKKERKLARTETLIKLSQFSTSPEKKTIPNVLFSLSLDIEGIKISSDIFPSLPLM